MIDSSRPRPDRADRVALLLLLGLLLLALDVLIAAHDRPPERCECSPAPEQQQ